MAAHYVYRLFNESGDLLYVGISKRAVTRLQEHHRDKPWADEIVDMQAKRYPSRDAARAAEVEAIQTENPRYNIRDRGKDADPGEDIAKLWAAMDAGDRQLSIETLERFLGVWPDSWTSPSDRVMRTALVASVAMMRGGASPTEALDSIYPERHRRKSRKVSPCPSCGVEKATFDDSRDYVAREHAAAFECSPCALIWTVNYDWNSGRAEVLA